MENSKQKLRFLAVGGFNTLLDFGLLFAFKSAGLPVITSNILSTTIAFCVSFIANKKFTFKTSGTDVRREILLFIVVTLFGLWVLQTIIIAVFAPIIAPFVQSEDIALFISKIIATIVTMIWNYVLYSRLVFRHEKK